MTILAARPVPGRRVVAVVIIVCCALSSCGDDPTDIATPSATPAPTALSSAVPSTPSAGPAPAASPTTVAPGPTPAPTPGADAEVPAGVLAVYRERVVYDGGDTVRIDHTAAFLDDGSFAIVDDAGSELIYDDETARRYSAFTWDDDRSANLDIGLAAGPPDPAGSAYPFDPGLLAYVRALERDERSVGLVEVSGRAGLSFETDLVPNAIGGGPDHVVVVVDARTGLLLSYEATVAGAPYRTIVADEVAVLASREDAAAAVDTTIPDDAGDPLDAGYRETSLDDAERLVGRGAPVPSSVPAGFALDRVRVLVGEGDSFTGAEGSNPPNVDVVSLRYRNGWATFTVATRVAVGGAPAWSDPFRGEGATYPSTPISLASGSMAGASGALVFTPEAAPSLWAVNDELVLTVTGSLPPEALRAIAESI